MTDYLPLVPVAAVLAFVSWLAWRIPYWHEDRDVPVGGLETCSILGCDAILRGQTYVWTRRGLRSQRICRDCGEEIMAVYPTLGIRPER